MEISIIEKDGKSLVTVKGRIDTTTADQFSAGLEPLMTVDKPQIEIDCSELVYISSLGLRAILKLQKSVGARGGSLVMTGMSHEVREIFDLTGFSTIIKIV